MKRKFLLPLPRTLLGGLLLISLMLSAIGWIADRAVDAAVAQRQLSLLTGDELQMVVNLPGLGIVVFGPVWLYRQLNTGRKAKVETTPL